MYGHGVWHDSRQLLECLEGNAPDDESEEGHIAGRRGLKGKTWTAPRRLRPSLRPAVFPGMRAALRRVSLPCVLDLATLHKLRQRAFDHILNGEVRMLALCGALVWDLGCVFAVIFMRATASRGSHPVGLPVQVLQDCVDDCNLRVELAVVHVTAATESGATIQRFPDPGEHKHRDESSLQKSIRFALARPPLPDFTTPPEVPSPPPPDGESHCRGFQANAWPSQVRLRACCA